MSSKSTRCSTDSGRLFFKKAWLLVGGIFCHCSNLIIKCTMKSGTVSQCQISWCNELSLKTKKTVNLMVVLKEKGSPETTSRGKTECLYTCILCWSYKVEVVILHWRSVNSDLLAALKAQRNEKVPDLYCGFQSFLHKFLSNKWWNVWVLIEVESADVAILTSRYLSCSS